MNNLKVKFGFFSLLAIFAVSVFLTSCEEQKQLEATIEVDANDNFSNYVGKAYKLPKGYDKWTGEEINKYLGKLTDQKFGELVENNRITAYLMSIGLWASIDGSLKEGGILTEVFVSNFLSDQQMEKLSEYNFDSELDLRWCTGCNFSYSYCPVNGCTGVSGTWYPVRNIYKRYCEPGHTYICKTTCSY